MLAPVVVHVLEVRVEGVVVHGDAGVGVVGQLRGVVEGHGLGPRRALVVLQRPVVAPGAEDDDGVGRIELAHVQRQQLLEPLL